MGVERAVTRWYALRQNIQREIEALQAQLETLATSQAPERESDATRQQLIEARARLQALGPCPRAMMG